MTAKATQTTAVKVSLHVTNFDSFTIPLQPTTIASLATNGVFNRFLINKQAISIQESN
jgi:hypothetical protein